ncbi:MULTISPECIES: sigma-70 family RNA polymerase sigma factor [Mycobacterium]|jgi:RNA polymerase sigma-70 factor (ECF subfamily)|uniref:RNA polymerase sigma factor n=1 Tax=Mycobacterium indicus pranii (strain DSM 45239 / MTCC 9506) TaxID=1232724 RepID=J9WIQ8_MYCIP|nr:MULTISPECIES: sigma-70 family RNA polymerase sigma factor [Mycobacterium]AFS14352.1 RNA polymerase sigma factor [Mycobacterium intracellulare subsp. intracellulare MTCC 9506]WRU84520.1 sigma-70 family RNA polymerase sigma factor [Mycobacterium sp. 5-140-3-2]WSE39336.1 sigma-70 family RNA polymerase sigma factor [Mycobacterium sp. 5-140-3-1]WSE49465.1 sigma-70 family RNA polymerase sigma factor [Mycobacterium sp. 2-64]WVL49949.1 sigma-70 family RNA polymerase sigma factor [Mycobacterium para
MGATTDLVALAERFDADRRHLRSVAFQLLGSVADADDAVQSAWLKASRADFRAVDNLSGWFTTITAREALDQLRARKRRAEQPLAEPDELDRLAEAASAPADEDALLAESVSSALLVVLDRLSPAQRVAFVLHDVFAMSFETIAELLHRSPDAAKKLASRARGRLQAAPAAQPRSTAGHLEVVEAFLAASRGGDIASLLELLAPDVVRTVDRSLVPADVPTTVRGARQVAEETRRFARRARAGAVMLIDGAPGIVIATHGRAQVLLVIGIGADDRIHTIDITGDAERIRRAALTLPARPIQEHHKLVGYQGRQIQPASGRERG